MAEFQLPERLETLQMEGNMAGAEIVCNLSCPLRIWTHLYEVAQGATVPKAAVDAMTEIVAVFRRWGLRSWNLADPDGPIPIEEFDRIPPLIQAEIIKTWMQTGMRISGPLASPSAAGAQSAEQSAQTASESKPRRNSKRP